MKKFISLALVLALAFCFSVTAFAAESPDGIVVSSKDPVNSPITAAEFVNLSDAELTAMANDPSTDTWLDKVPATPANNTVHFFLSMDVTSKGGKGDTLVFSNMDQVVGKIVLVYLDGKCIYAEVLNSNTLTVTFPHFSNVTLGYMDVATATGKVCPSCGKTTVELVGGKFHCTSCDHTWAEYTGAASGVAAGGPTSPKTGDAGVAAALVVALMAGVGVCAFARKDEAC